MNTPADIEGRRIFGAFEGEVMIGYLFGAYDKADRESTVMKADTRFFEVEELYIKPEYRSKGVGRRLYALAEDAVKGEGTEYIQLSTATKDYKAILHFYIDELDMTFWNATLYKKL